jgi:hypothetical protein
MSATGYFHLASAADDFTVKTEARLRYFINPAAVRARVMTAPTSMPRRFGARGAGLCWRTGLWDLDQSVAARSVDCRDSVAADGTTFGAGAGLAASLG